MTRTEELMRLAEAAYTSADDIEEFHYKANPTTIKQLITLVRLQHEAVKQYAKMMPLYQAGIDALEAFNKFEGGE